MLEGRLKLWLQRSFEKLSEVDCKSLFADYDIAYKIR